jgi:hypothetical protein
MPAMCSFWEGSRVRKNRQEEIKRYRRGQMLKIKIWK